MYIEREALIKAVAESLKNNPHKDAKVSVNHITEHQHFARMVERQPAADVVEVVHGRWETVPNREFDGFETVVRGEAERCTHCCRASKDFKKWFAICPNCGCKMDGERKEPNV